LGRHTLRIGVFVRFGFDELESRKFIDKSRAKQQRTPHGVYYIQSSLASSDSIVCCYECIYMLTLAWGFRRCSFRLVGQCESLNSWNEWQNRLRASFYVSSPYISLIVIRSH